MSWEIRSENGHYVVYRNGYFFGSYDSFKEAVCDIEDAFENGDLA